MDGTAHLAAAPAAIGLARRCASRFARALPHLRDDIEGAALVGLVRAAASFDPARGVPFRAHAILRVTGEVKEFLRMEAPRGFRRRAAAPAVSPLSGVGGGGGAFAHSLPSGDLPVGWELEAEDAVRGLLAGLGPRARRWLTAAYTEAAVAGSVARAAARDGKSERLAHLEAAAGLAHLRGILAATKGGA